MRRTRWLAGLVVLSTLTLLTLAPSARAAEVDLHARLHGSATYPKATGFSEYERGSRHREVEITVRNIRSLAGKRVSVYVAGTKVGTIRVRTTGVAHREWDTEHGDSVPVAFAGSRVRVRTAGGTLVAAGKYVRSGED